MKLDSLEKIVNQIQEQINSLPLITLNQLTGTDELNSSQQIEELINNAVNHSEAEIKNRIIEEFFGFGPLTPLLNQSDITEIIVNGLEKIWIERNGMLTQIEDRFLSAITFDNAIQRICRETHIQITIDQPFADGFWKNCRVHVGASPVCNYAYVLSLRKHPKYPWTLQNLCDNGWCNGMQLEKIKRLIETKKNFIVVGPTGAGKTTVLNSCLKELKFNERAVIIEDSSELSVPNSICTKLLSREDPQGVLKSIDLAFLLRQSLRMRPDRLIMGEIRGPEAKDLLLALSTGHAGSWGTLHASTPQQAITRLEMLIQLGAPNWNHHAIRSLIFMSLQSILVVTKNSSQKRVLEGIYDITSFEENGFLMEKFNP